jgi:hypothetical protein
MTRIIKFVGKTYKRLAAALRALYCRYSFVNIYPKLKNGLYEGYFEVGRYLKQKRVDFQW